MSDLPPAKRYRCKRCGYEWPKEGYEERAGAERPKQCARCRSRSWDKEPGEVKRGPRLKELEVTFAVEGEHDA